MKVLRFLAVSLIVFELSLSLFVPGFSYELEKYSPLDATNCPKAYKPEKLKDYKNQIESLIASGSSENAVAEAVLKCSKDLLTEYYFNDCIYLIQNFHHCVKFNSSQEALLYEILANAYANRQGKKRLAVSPEVNLFSSSAMSLNSSLNNNLFYSEELAQCLDYLIKAEELRFGKNHLYSAPSAFRIAALANLCGKKETTIIWKDRTVNALNQMRIKVPADSEHLRLSAYNRFVPRVNLPTLAETFNGIVFMCFTLGLTREVPPLATLWLTKYRDLNLDNYSYARLIEFLPTENKALLIQSFATGSGLASIKDAIVKRGWVYESEHFNEGDK